MNETQSALKAVVEPHISHVQKLDSLPKGGQWQKRHEIGRVAKAIAGKAEKAAPRSDVHNKAKRVMKAVGLNGWNGSGRTQLHTRVRALRESMELVVKPKRI